MTDSALSPRLSWRTLPRSAGGPASRSRASRQDRGRKFRPERGRVNLEPVLVVENRKDWPIPEARRGVDVGEPLVEGSFAADRHARTPLIAAEPARYRC